MAGGLYTLCKGCSRQAEEAVQITGHASICLFLFSFHFKPVLALDLC
jgi:hypothetical protein